MKRNTTAIHEAAHAVAFVLLFPGFSPRSVTIEPTESTLGHCLGPSILECIEENPAAPRPLIRARAMAALAGPLAEAFVTGENPDYNGGGRKDFKHAQFIATAPGLNFERLEADTSRWCRRHWPKILAVADALEERRTLSGRETEVVVHRSMNKDTAKVQAVLLGVFRFVIANDFSEDQIAHAIAGVLTEEGIMDETTGCSDLVFTGPDIARLRLGLLAGFRLAKGMVG
jgi:hypothetical protein